VDAAEPTVRVEPLGAELRVRTGERLMAAAERLGYRWPTLCHGQAACTTCWVEVEDPEAFEPPAPLEVKGLSLFDGRSFYAGKNIRLACQARPLRNTVVTKRGVRDPSDTNR
jgi:2Fe-2S ferredoxin